jgi:hypothetical protein
MSSSLYPAPASSTSSLKSLELKTVPTSRRWAVLCIRPRAILGDPSGSQPKLEIQTLDSRLPHRMPTRPGLPQTQHFRPVHGHCSIRVRDYTEAFLTQGFSPKTCVLSPMSRAIRSRSESERGKRFLRRAFQSVNRCLDARGQHSLYPGEIPNSPPHVRSLNAVQAPLASQSDSIGVSSGKGISRFGAGLSHPSGIPDAEQDPWGILVPEIRRNLR